VTIDHQLFSSISNGLLIFIGIEDTDNEEDIGWLSSKISNLRIFDDQNGKMNLSVKDIDGELLLISQFTLYASIKKGTRPSFLKAAKAEVAIPVYEKMISELQIHIAKTIKTGVFGADMKVSFTNDGPVTILLDTKNKQ